MAKATPCGHCKQVTSWICAAQFYNGEDEHIIICYDCWRAGKRCFIGPNGLVVNNKAPSDEYREAALFYDEGGFVTGGEIPMTYPDMNQPIRAD
jgi:hypothetical protein